MSPTWMFLSKILYLSRLLLSPSPIPLPSPSSTPFENYVLQQCSFVPGETRNNLLLNMVEGITEEWCNDEEEDDQELNPRPFPSYPPP
eukprot:CAMPEP_0118663774 /NCGR_PEP_ID=MMETSP0785-20121206/17623_1 /TAXON_ID=91992 /ORGANISM="Bolidomonas pacifica, Strain CCMP 1866" /LENGTH=87 /DNA_ID=CAMNT_0006557565 /DNA_START=43 /DNA_END=303 /DNA_ORIENTATION=-